MNCLKTFILTTLLAVSMTSCTATKTLSNDKLGVSMLVVNLRDVMNVPSSVTGVTWEVRYQRVIDWIVAQPSLPDVITLQEMPVWWTCDSTPFVKDYAPMNRLISAIRARTNIEYRVAYSMSHTWAGGNGEYWIHSVKANRCNGRSGRALLYRPDKLRNVQQDAGESFNSQNIAGSHFLNSVPCCNPAANDASVCRLVDGPVINVQGCSAEVHAGAALTRRQTPTDNSLDAVFARLELRASPGSYIHIYNVQLKYNNNMREPAAASINQLVMDAEARYTQPDRLYPPFLLGDFNIDGGNVTNYFPTFKTFLYSREVIGILSGDPATYPSKQTAYPHNAQILPEHGCDALVDLDTFSEFQLDPAILWTDHCASVYVRVEPTP